MSKMNNIKNSNEKSCTESNDGCGIQHPHPHDVLSGRGSLTNLHIGNINFRQLVEYNKKRYASSMKQHKMIVSKSIVKAIRNQDPPGRFLQFDPCTGLWKEIGNSRALSKTSQTLRETPTIYAKLFDADFLGDESEIDKEGNNDVLTVDSSGSSQTKPNPKASEEGKCELKSSLSNTNVLPENDRGNKNSDFFFFCESLKKLPENERMPKANVLTKPALKKVTVPKKVDTSSANQTNSFGHRGFVIQDTNALTLTKAFTSPNESNEFLSLMPPSTDLNSAPRNFFDRNKRPPDIGTRKVTLDGNQMDGPNKRRKLSTLMIDQSDKKLLCQRFCQRSLSSSKYNPFRSHIFVSKGLNGVPNYNGEHRERIIEPTYRSHAVLRIENSPSNIRPYTVKDEVRCNVSMDPLSLQSLSAAHADSLSALCNTSVLENRKQTDPLSNSKSKSMNGHLDIVPFEVHSNPDLRGTMNGTANSVDSNFVWYKDTIEKIETTKNTVVVPPYYGKILNITQTLNPGNQIAMSMMNKHLPSASSEAQSR